MSEFVLECKKGTLEDEIRNHKLVYSTDIRSSRFRSNKHRFSELVINFCDLDSNDYMNTHCYNIRVKHKIIYNLKKEIELKI